MFGGGIDEILVTHHGSSEFLRSLSADLLSRAVAASELSGRQTQSFRSSVRYWIASPIWEESMFSEPARSAIVRATLRMRS